MRRKNILATTLSNVFTEPYLLIPKEKLDAIMVMVSFEVMVIAMII